MNEELILDVMSYLLRKRGSVADTSYEYAMLTDAVEFVKTWGTKQSAFVRRPPQIQFSQVFVNGQPVDPAAMGGQWNTTQ